LLRLCLISNLASGKWFPALMASFWFFAVVAMPVVADALRMILAAVRGTSRAEGQLRDAVSNALIGQSNGCHDALAKLQTMLPSVENTWEQLRSSQAPDPDAWYVMQNSTVKQVADECQTSASLVEVLVWLLFVPEIGRPAATQVVETLADQLGSTWRRLILRRVQEAMLSGDFSDKHGSALLALASCETNSLDYDGLRFLVQALIFRRNKRAARRLGAIASKCTEFPGCMLEFRALFNSVLAGEIKQDLKAVLETQLKRLAKLMPGNAG